MLHLIFNPNNIISCHTVRCRSKLQRDLRRYDAAIFGGMTNFAFHKACHSRSQSSLCSLIISTQTFTMPKAATKGPTIFMDSKLSCSRNWILHRNYADVVPVADNSGNKSHPCSPHGICFHSCTLNNHHTCVEMSLVRCDCNWCAAVPSPGGLREHTNPE